MKKISIIFSSILIFSIFTTNLSAKTFTDVKDDEIYKTGIEFLSEMGIISGHPDGSYKPLDTLNRAEMLKIIAEGSMKYNNQSTGVLDDYTKQSCFKDVKTTAWYNKYICYGKAKGWVVGYENGKFFKPEQKVSFVEALKMSYKAFDMPYEETSTPWFKDLVTKASEKNYIPHTIHAFHNALQRNQMADMITRMIKYDMGEADFEAYLGNRIDIVVSYETIEKGQDLSKLEIEIKTTNEAKADIMDEGYVNLTGSNPFKWIEISWIKDSEVENLPPSSKKKFLDQNKGFSYFINAPICTNSSCTDQEEWNLEVEEITASFVFSDKAEGSNVYINKNPKFSLNFPENWGTISEGIFGLTGDSQVYIVEMTSGGFFPELITIKKGGTIKFINKNSMVDHWPASDVHPTHTLYPGTDDSLCGKPETGKIFDSCGPIKFEKFFEFTFDEKGTWTYHDHLDPGLKGTVKVE